MVSEILTLYNRIYIANDGQNASWFRYSRIVWRFNFHWHIPVIEKGQKESLKWIHHVSKANYWVLKGALYLEFYKILLQFISEYDFYLYNISSNVCWSLISRKMLVLISCAFQGIFTCLWVILKLFSWIYPALPHVQGAKPSFDSKVDL